MRHYHVLVEFTDPIGHARAFARISESQVRHHFILPWAKGDVPIGPDRDVMAAQVSRLRVFRAADQEEAAASLTKAMTTGLEQDVTDLFLSEIGVRAKWLKPRRPLLLAAGAAALAVLAVFRSRRSGAAKALRPSA
jgi:hypothetical protein